jgi:hypothetical protein
MAIYEKLKTLTDSVVSVKSALKAKGASIDGASLSYLADKTSRLPVWDSFKSPLAQLGYTSEDEAIYKDLKIDMTTVKEDVEYSLGLKKSKDGITNSGFMFSEDTKLVYAPNVDLSKASSLIRYAYNCKNLKAATLHIGSNIGSLEQAFYMAKSIETISIIGNNATNITSLRLFASDTFALKSLDLRSISLSKVSNMEALAWRCTQLTTLWLNGFGEYPDLVCNAIVGSNSQPVPWGTGSDEARQSLIDSLITYSFDRAAAGYDALTITLSTATKNVLTDEEKAAITAKGFTIA